MRIDTHKKYPRILRDFVRDHISGGHVCKKDTSNIGKDVKVFVILVLASFSLAKGLFRFDEFNASYPLHHFVAGMPDSVGQRGTACGREPRQCDVGAQRTSAVRYSDTHLRPALIVAPLQKQI
jgi:hypothetical protein